jgi:hypothetical protein
MRRARRVRGTEGGCVSKNICLFVCGVWCRSMESSTKKRETNEAMVMLVEQQKRRDRRKRKIQDYRPDQDPYRNTMTPSFP